jgi:hypothetical protein
VKYHYTNFVGEKGIFCRPDMTADAEEADVPCDSASIGALSEYCDECDRAVATIIRE